MSRKIATTSATTASDEGAETVMGKAKLKICAKAAKNVSKTKILS